MATSALKSSALKRSAPERRFEQLMDAGIRVFCEKGYRRTQMADIAAEMKVSPGTLYNYVESKEALFDLLIDRGLGNGQAEPPPSFPVRTPPPGATLARIRHRLKTGGRLKKLEAALASRAVADPRGELEGVVRELYDLLYTNGRATILIERSALDVPELAQLFYVEFRRNFIARLAEYVDRRIKDGSFRPVPDAGAAARLIIETSIWFARNRLGDLDSKMIDDRTAIETVTHFIVSALVPDGARGRNAGLSKRAVRAAHTEG